MPTVEGSLKGRLLVATPSMGDPNFERTIVLLIEHGAEGALGVVLNRPSPLEVREPLPHWDGYAAEPAVVFVGGPVAHDAVIGLARGGAQGRTEGWTPLSERVGVVDLNLHPDDLAAAVEEIRVFAGYAGWGGGQLEDELAADAWFVVDSLADDVVTPQPLDLWRAVLRRQGGTLRLLANFPPHPTVN